ncbi:MAG TPA: hypothetical protein VEI81_03365 [Methanoregula sp.]|nr:hypothetical protein [Methanoregula sp.]
MTHHHHPAEGTASPDAATKSCRFCAAEYSHEDHPSSLGLCHGCAFKVLILLVAVMVIVSYVAWFGIV